MSYLGCNRSRSNTTQSLRDVEELLAQRGVEVSDEAIRCWIRKFGPQIAANLRLFRAEVHRVWATATAAA